MAKLTIDPNAVTMGQAQRAARLVRSKEWTDEYALAVVIWQDQYGVSLTEAAGNVDGLTARDIEIVQDEPDPNS